MGVENPTSQAVTNQTCFSSSHESGSMAMVSVAMRTSANRRSGFGSRSMEKKTDAIIVVYSTSPTMPSSTSTDRYELWATLALGPTSGVIAALNDPTP